MATARPATVLAPPGLSPDLTAQLKQLRHAGLLQVPSVPEISPLREGFGLLLDHSSSGIALGGHRGMGMNFRVPGQLPAFRENTVASFLRAAEMGATFVEFDVQVTADGVPVIWHDDTAVWREPSGSVRQAAIADLTLAEFKRLPQRAADKPLLRNFHEPDGTRDAAATEWHCSIEDKLPTLAEVFARVPEHVGFDIEVKMTSPATVERTPPAEVDRVVSAVLGSMAYMSASRRRMMFSSFDPEVCAALRARQQHIPVLFLSDGAPWHVDERRNSVAAAIEFALGAGLQGLVLEAGALRRQLHMVAHARRQGLQVLTFGLDNNEPAFVAQQHALGISAAILDDVEGVASTLRHGTSVPVLSAA